MYPFQEVFDKWDVISSAEYIFMFDYCIYLCSYIKNGSFYLYLINENRILCVQMHENVYKTAGNIIQIIGLLLKPIGMLAFFSIAN